jgi:uncharacterized protein YbaA (DUF1428 family)
MTYIDGYLVPVRADRTEAYRVLAERSSRIMKEYGALRVVECWPDAEPDGDGKFHGIDAREALKERSSDAIRDFAGAGGAQAGEVVMLSWTEWPDKATRDRGLAAAMADPRLQFAGEELVFDGKRLIASGFVPLVVR